MVIPYKDFYIREPLSNRFNLYTRFEIQDSNHGVIHTIKTVNGKRIKVNDVVARKEAIKQAKAFIDNEVNAVI